MFVEVLSGNLVMSDVWFYFLYLFFHRQTREKVIMTEKKVNIKEKGI